MGKAGDVLFIIAIVILAACLVCRYKHDPDLYKRAFLEGYDTRIQYEHGR
jgi:hypothetical protein